MTPPRKEWVSLILYAQCYVAAEAIPEGRAVERYRKANEFKVRVANIKRGSPAVVGVSMHAAAKGEPVWIQYHGPSYLLAAPRQ